MRTKRIKLTLNLTESEAKLLADTMRLDVARNKTAYIVRLVSERQREILPRASTGARGRPPKDDADEQLERDKERMAEVLEAIEQDDKAGKKLPWDERKALESERHELIPKVARAMRPL